MEQLSIFDITDKNRCQSCEHYVPDVGGRSFYCEVSKECIMNSMYEQKKNWNSNPIVPKYHFSLNSVWAECKCRTQPDYLREDRERCPYCGQKLIWNWEEIYKKASISRDLLVRKAKKKGFASPEKASTEELRSFVLKCT